MPHAKVGDVELFYETFGNPEDPPLLLIMGLGAQMIAWPDEFCEGLVDRAFYVIRFDNRDIGLSTAFESDVDYGAAMAAGEKVEPPYTLNTMAADAAGLLEALDIEAAHIVGASMGGMIAQLVAIEHPAKTLTLTSIMSTTSETDVGQPTVEAITAITGAAPTERDAAIDHNVKIGEVWASPDYWNPEHARERAEANWDRVGKSQGPGIARQMAAILAAPSRAEALAGVTVPALVIHGTVDPLVQPDGGRRTADVLPNAELLEIEGMGHDLPPEMYAQIIETITRLAIRALNE